MKYLSHRCLTCFFLVLLWLLPCHCFALQSEDCQGCHADPEVVGEHLFIDANAYATTTHSEVGCLSCHEMEGEDHPDDGLAISEADCLDCHSEVADEYMVSAHADNAACGDCHNPHRVHGLNDVSGYDLNRACAACHEQGDVLAAHNEWLPQADRHIAKLPCISCHTASEEYRIILYISQRESNAVFGDFELSGFEDLQVLAGEGGVQQLIDLNEDNLISLVELRTFNRNPEYKALRLQGTLTPKTASHSLKTLDNRSDCSFCHTSGTDQLQSSFLALPTREGTFKRVPVEQGAILQALSGTPDFYMLGTTRSASLNIIGLMIIAGGLVMPIGHGTLRFLTRHNRDAKGE